MSKNQLSAPVNKLRNEFIKCTENIEKLESKLEKADDKSKEKLQKQLKKAAEDHQIAHDKYMEAKHPEE